MNVRDPGLIGDDLRGGADVAHQRFLLHLSRAHADQLLLGGRDR